MVAYEQSEDINSEKQATADCNSQLEYAAYGASVLCFDKQQVYVKQKSW